MRGCPLVGGSIIGGSTVIESSFGACEMNDHAQCIITIMNAGFLMLLQYK